MFGLAVLKLAFVVWLPRRQESTQVTALAVTRPARHGGSLGRQRCCHAGIKSPPAARRSVLCPGTAARAVAEWAGGRAGSGRQARAEPASQSRD